MKVKTLVAFGCSVTYGDELLDPSIYPETDVHKDSNTEYRLSNCFAGRVAQHYGLELINTAICGTSMESMRYALYWAMNNLNTDECIFLAGLTYAYRVSYYDSSRGWEVPWNRHSHGSWLINGSGTDYHDMHKLYVANCSHPDWEQFNLEQTVGYFSSTGVRTVLLPVFDNQPKFTSPLSTSFTVDEILHPQDRAPHGHPNETGHKKVASRLIQHIDHATILA